MKFWTLIFTIIPIALLLVGIDIVGAQTDPPPRTLIDMSLGGSSTTGRPDIVAYLNSLFAVALGLAAIIAVIKIIIAGVKYMLSDVVTNKASAKDDIKNALLGLIILLAVFLILYTINPNLTRLDIFTRLQQLPAVSAPSNSQNTTQPIQNQTQQLNQAAVALAANAPAGCGLRSSDNSHPDFDLVVFDYTECPSTNPGITHPYARDCRARGGRPLANTTQFVCRTPKNSPPPNTQVPNIQLGTVLQPPPSSYSRQFTPQEITAGVPATVIRECVNVWGEVDRTALNRNSTITCNIPEVVRYTDDGPDFRIDCRNRGGTFGSNPLDSSDNRGYCFI